MATASVNYTDILTPSVNFSISSSAPLSAYTLTWNGGQYEGSQDFTDANRTRQADAKIVPVETLITFTPIFNIPSNNSIVQYKWSFGDGVSQLVANVSNGVYPETTHIYNTSIAPIVGNGCLIATLTAIDQYYRHSRAYKVIYIKR